MGYDMGQDFYDALLAVGEHNGARSVDTIGKVRQLDTDRRRTGTLDDLEECRMRRLSRRCPRNSILIFQNSLTGSIEPGGCCRAVIDNAQSTQRKVNLADVEGVLRSGRLSGAGRKTARTWLGANVRQAWLSPRLKAILVGRGGEEFGLVAGGLVVEGLGQPVLHKGICANSWVMGRLCRELCTVGVGEEN